MPDIKGTRRKPFKLASGDEVHVFSNPEVIWLQLRHQASGDELVLAPSFKVAVELSAVEAIALAGELLTCASVQLLHTTPQEVGED